MTWREGVPDLLSGCTCEDFQERLDSVKYEIGPDEYVDAVVDKVVLVRHEYSSVLQEDGKFCDGDDRSVDDGADVRRLNETYCISLWYKCLSRFGYLPSRL